MYETKLIITLENNETIIDTLDLAKEKTNEKTITNLIITNKNIFFQVYSDEAEVGESYKIIGRTFKNVIELNKEENSNLKGFSGTITIDSENGVGEVPFNFENFSDFEVITIAEDSLRAEARIDKKDDKFIVRLFDSEGFVEFGQTLNCKKQSVDVHYIVVMKKDN